MCWKFNDVRYGQSIGSINLSNVRMGIVLIVDITRIENGVKLCINGEDVDVPFGKVVDTKDYKIRCYKDLNQLNLFVS